jgi:hypothetical protein
MPLKNWKEDLYKNMPARAISGRLENAMEAIDAILEGEPAMFQRVDSQGKTHYVLYVKNPYYNPEVQGEPPSLTIDFDDLKYFLEHVIIIAE